MKNVIIIGARGFGREVLNLLTFLPDYNKKFIIKGFLDDKKDALVDFDGYPQIISSVEDYQIEKDDVFVCALGDCFFRKKYVDIIKQKEGEFMNVIHPSCSTFSDLKFGEGVILYPFCSITTNVKIGDFTVIHSFSNIGHDVRIGDFCTIESHAFMGGFSSIGNLVTLHTRSTLLPHKKMDDYSASGVGSVIMRNVKKNITVFGNPAREI